MFPRANGKSKRVTAICIDCGSDFETPQEYVTRDRNRKVRCDVCQKVYVAEQRKSRQEEYYAEKKNKTFIDRPGRYVINEDHIPMDKRRWSNCEGYCSDEYRPRMNKIELQEAKKNGWFARNTIIIDSETGNREVL